MAVFKCKMCGGTLEINNNESVVTCDYCNTQQTLPKLNDDRKANLYDRANHFRRNNEFDKAMGIYEQILNEDNTDSEAYWSLVLCRYGIEYVEDPATHKRVPTVNRAQFTSVFDDSNYKAALEYADSYQKAVYEEEAKAINEIQKGILAISQKEEPFDVFICYKESDNSGRRTPDSVLANDLYHQLTQEGYKVFFSRITLEDKLGSAYEPYIFAALNSAKVMVVLGTKPEYFNAVWVKNEWSRYLALIKSGAKKMLIPAYKDMDPYDLPEEFSHLQAQDMSKLGFMQDLIRGIKKIAGAEENKAVVVKETVVTEGNASTAPLLKRVFMFLEDGKWKEADEYCEKVLDLDPENAAAYLGKLMAELEVEKKECLKEEKEEFEDYDNCQKVYRFGDERLKKELEGYNEHIRNRNETARLDGIYAKAMKSYESAETEEACKQVAEIFGSINYHRDSAEWQQKCLKKAEKCKWERIESIYQSAVDKLTKATTRQQCEEAVGLFTQVKEYKEASSLIKQCAEKSEVIRKDNIYEEANKEKEKNTIEAQEAAIQKLQTIAGWKDANGLVLECERKIEEIKKAEERERREAEAKAKRNKRNAIIAAMVVCIVVAVIIVMNTVIIPNNKYNKALAAMETGEYEEAIIIFESLNGYKDSQKEIEECKYKQALEYIENENYIEAYDTLEALNGYKDSSVKAESIYKEYIIEKGKLAKAGDYIIFGNYEQDNNTANGKEEIEWLVLERQENKLLVISKYALDCKQYHSTETTIAWENCTLRSWLNQEFINAAFSETEKNMIPAVNVTADRNPEYDTNPGKDTTDQVFLLSIKEVKTYFGSDAARQCKPTDYAVANNAWVADNGNCWWWLRSPGSRDYHAASVYVGGGVSESGNDVGDVTDAVRPALWINLDS